MHPEGVDGHVSVPGEDRHAAEDNADGRCRCDIHAGDQRQRGADRACKHRVAGHGAAGSDETNVRKVNRRGDHHALQGLAHNEADKETGPDGVEPGSRDGMAEPPGAARCNQRDYDCFKNQFSHSFSIHFELKI
ncbi:hypothetical protein SDC9_102301 [bioreactor metagenome]|uniref:Uncharacterized protein n=1 Tax=bioreactor metagenome TaxID=1076179 RepID=A0A645B198_9ZZZZ